MTILSKKQLYPIGSRKFNISDDDSDYNFILVSNKIPEILKLFTNYDIISVSKNNDIRYRISGTAGEEASILLSIPEGAQFVIFLTNGERCLLENTSLYQMINMSFLNLELKDRVLQLKKVAKRYNVYGGAFPSGISYCIFANNTYKKGYSLQEAINSLGKKYLYYHEDFRYHHMSCVSNKSLMYLASQVRQEPISCKYQVRISTEKKREVLSLAYKFLDTTPALFMTNDCIIGSDVDIQPFLEKWREELLEFEIII